MGKSPREVKFTVSDRTHTTTSASHKEDVSILITSVCLKIVGLWHAKDHVEQRRRNFMLVYTACAMLYSLFLQTRDFYYSWPNFSDCAYVASNMLCLILILFKLFVVYKDRKKLFELILYTYKHFWHTNYDDNEKVMIAGCKRLCSLSIGIINFCVQSTLISYILTPIVANIGRNQSDRIYPFRIWIDSPILTTSPYFEMIFASQALALLHIGICYISFDNLLCLLNLHVTTQFRILQYRLTNLASTDAQKSSVVLSDYAEQCYSRFKCCVQQHKAQIQYCNRLENIFTIIILAHVLNFSMLFCLLGYQIFLVEESLVKRSVSVFHIMADLCSLLLFTSSCDGLIEESSNIGWAIYSGPWIDLPMDHAGKKLRRDLSMVIQRSRKPCCLTGYGFFPVSLETYTSVISTGMSYFTLIRQSMVN